jgi:uncharacterized RDD family membrane protein YckC
LSTSPQSAVYDDDSSEMTARLPAWKQEINERLVAHRSRRTRNPEAQPVLPGMESAASRPEAARSVAARVAERYSRVPSYREALAAEAANAARAAEAAAKAAQKAHQAAQAMNEVLWADLEEPEEELAPEPVPEPAPPIRYHVDPGSLPQQRKSAIPQAAAPVSRRGADIVDPFEDCVVAPAQPLPVRILEFPRELVAARKARPRHAEGPLREEPLAPEKSQLRIFEVEADAISHEPVASKPVEEQVLPEWHSIRLDARPEDARPHDVRPLSASAVAGPASAVSPAAARPGRRNADGSQSKAGNQPTARGTGDQRGNGNAGESSPRHSPVLDLGPLYVASMEDRLMAGIVDLALVLISFLLFVLVIAACTAHPPTGKPALAYATIALIGFFALYQWIFFTYADGTPGMRYAKIALCTFDDENPSRKAMQWRIAALFLSAVPVGLGFLWALFDEDGLGWHDRITRTYQRSYR